MLMWKIKLTLFKNFNGGLGLAPVQLIKMGILFYLRYINIILKKKNTQTSESQKKKKVW